MTQGQVAESAPDTGAVAPASQTDAAPAASETPSGPATPQEQSAPAEESFSHIDPKTLPPELQAVYKNLQADYTRKTQSIADARKKAEAYDQISKDQRFVDYWKGLSRQEKAEFKEQKEEAEKRLGEKISDTEFAKAFESKDDFLNFLERVVSDRSEKAQKKIADLEQKLSVKEAQDLVDAYATEQDKEGKALRPDFYKLDEDQLITGFLRLNAPETGYTPQQYQGVLDQAYQWAKATTQKYYDLGKAEALKIIQQKAASSTNPPTGAAKGAYTGPDPKKLSPSEAFQMAKKGIRVPQEY